jgi:hypothetical protein
VKENDRLHSDAVVDAFREAGRGLGRRPESRPEQANYPMARLLEGIDPTQLPAYKYWWARGEHYDQGATGTCVGHAWAHWVENAPVTHPEQHVDPYEIYKRACDVDPWPQNDGPNYDLNFGTSTDAGAKAVRQLGFIDSFYWTWSVDEASDHVLGRGPFVIGVNWYESMFNPRWVEVQKDVWRWTLVIDEKEGGVAGGHAVLVNGRNKNHGTFRIKNSWGTWWGVNGQVSIKDDTLGRLLSEQGEFVAAVEKKPS